jgi:putative transposase
VIREADGRHYASFAVEAAAAPLPAAASDAGTDPGLPAPAATSDGEPTASPRHLRARERKLAKAQRAMARKVKGPANREKARVRIAVQHRKVRETRGRSPPQDGSPAGPRQPSGPRRRSGSIRAGPHQAGEVRA